MLFDTHAHLTDPAFDEDREAILSGALAAGVRGVVSIASDPEDAERAIALARRMPDRLRATVGVHPNCDRELPRDLEGRLRELARAPEVVALGETGLDHHYDFVPATVQRERFELHLRLAGELGLPVVVHTRNADREMESVLRGLPPGVRGVLHCFTGGRALLEAALEKGWSLSFGGVTTFRNYDGGELLRAIPADRYFLETDSPYLAPVPLRGKRNEPSRLPLIRDAVARHRGVTPEVVAEETTRNALRFFRLPESWAESPGGTP